jgi:hypothetical protein
MFGGEATITAEDDVDDVRQVLVTLRPQLVSLLILFVLPLFILVRKWSVEALFILVRTWSVEGVTEANALEKGVPGLRVH